MSTLFSELAGSWPVTKDREKILEAQIRAYGELPLEQCESLIDETYGTGWFSNVVADKAHNKLTQGFQQASEAWKKICEIVDVNDLKEQHSTHFSGIDPLDEKVDEFAEYSSVEFKDDQEKYTPGEYGGIFSITRKAKANDAIGAFMKWSQRAGMAAAARVEKLVFYDILCASGGAGMTMNDAAALFTAGRGNLTTGAGALSKANLAAMIDDLLGMTGINGETLHLLPRYLIVEKAQYLTALELTSDIYQTSAGAGALTQWGEPNIFGGRGLGITVLYSPYLTAGRYVLCADPRTAPLVEVGFYNGREPKLSQENPDAGLSFATGGTRYRVTLDVSGTALTTKSFIMYQVA